MGRGRGLRSHECGRVLINLDKPPTPSAQQYPLTSP